MNLFGHGCYEAAAAAARAAADSTLPLRAVLCYCITLRCIVFLLLLPIVI